VGGGYDSRVSEDGEVIRRLHHDPAWRHARDIAAACLVELEIRARGSRERSALLDATAAVLWLLEPRA
jgi:hypothetical protein